jgi:hypothetical protein
MRRSVRPKARWVVVALGLALALAVWRPWSAAASRRARADWPAAPPARVSAAGATSAAPLAEPSSSPAPVVAPTAPVSRTFAALRWGSGAGQLGHKRPREGNPEGPMSVAVDGRGDALVVDQVNGRLVRLGPGGIPHGEQRVGEGAQDVAVARDGTVAVLDRLLDKAVTLYAPDGRAVGTLAIEGKGIAEGGQVTGVFVDGGDVYVEREHGQLVRVGSTTGDPGGGRTELPGRPTRDGTSFVSAGIDGGRVYLTANTRATGQHRYTRPLPDELAVRGLLLLDTDRLGTVYVVTLSAAPDGTPSESLVCAALADGHVLGSVPVTPNTMPEETFREFAVMDGGGVLHEEMSDEGATFVRYDCP